MRTASLTCALLLALLGLGKSSTVNGTEPETVFAATPRLTVSETELSKILSTARGFCVQIGSDLEVDKSLDGNRHLLVHRLVSKTSDSKPERQDHPGRAIVEVWERQVLPHADNLAGLIVVHNEQIPLEEISRVLAPGGSAFISGDDGFERLTKARPDNMDSWTHQWHDADGALTTNDQVGVPSGLNWVTGPLFAMAGRKNSTQSLVSANGINFYVTQNVLENYGKAEMPQFLVARDAFNGILLWQRPWTGEFVTGNGETNPRMVVTDDRLFVAGETAVIAIEPSTGETLCEVPLTSPANKLVFAFDSLFVQTRSGVTCFDGHLREELWSFDSPKTSALVVTGEELLLLVGGRSPDGRFKHELVSVAPSNGAERWRVNTQNQLSAESVRINFAEDGLVALQAHGSLHVFSTSDGKHLWSQETDARPGKTYVDERYVGHFYKDGIVWLLQENSLRTPLGQNIWVGLDAQTGLVKRELKTKGAWPRTETPAKMGCQLLIASDRYIMIPRQSTFIDFESGEKLPFKFTRGGCGLGFVPANGLVYSHPHACGCFSEAIRGFMGMHSVDVTAFRSSGARLSHGPAIGQQPSARSSSGNWSMHRKDGRRSAFQDVIISTDLDLKWSTAISTQEDSISLDGWKLRNGNRISAATIEDYTIFVVDIDSGTVKALNAESGQSKWQFTASGRVDAPPTIYRGLCLFGSHDGYVYALSSSSGELVWKLRAAPTDRRIIAFDSVESTWPVSGAVLIKDEVAFVAAGRAPDADGGMEVLAIQPFTGEVIWTQRVAHERFNGQCDFMIDGDNSVHLSNWTFDPGTGDNARSSESATYLRGGKVGLLEPSWTKHDLATRKEIQTWKAKGVSGQLLAFSPEKTVSYDADTHLLKVNCAQPWSVEIAAPAQLTSLALTENAVVTAGGVDRADTSAGGWLKVFSSQDGKLLFSAPLPSEAVFDGLSIANEQILVGTQDGKLHCFGPRMAH